MSGQFREAISCFWGSYGGKIALVQVVFKGNNIVSYVLGHASVGESLRCSEPALIKFEIC